MFVINPGTEPILDTEESNAIDNIRHFVTDIGEPRLKWVRIPECDYGDGRYAFLVWKNNQCWEIQMPGLPLEQVRWMDDHQNPWHYPRLYVDDSSWLWKFAINNVEFNED